MSWTMCRRRQFCRGVSIPVDIQKVDRVQMAHAFRNDLRVVHTIAECR